MKFTVQKSVLSNVTSIVQRAASSKDALPVLSCLSITAGSQGLSMIATDMEIGMKMSVSDVAVKESGTILVNARHFNDLIRYLPETELSIILDREKNKLKVQYGRSSTYLNVYDDEEFPELPLGKIEKLFTVPQKDLKEAIKKTAFAAAANHFKVLFTGILFDFEGEVLRIVASDTHRLALIEKSGIEKTDVMKRFVLPARNINELVRILEDEDQVITVGMAENNVVFYSEEQGFFFMSRVIEGEYPNYNNVIPKNFTTQMIVDSNLIVESLERASLMPADPKSIKHVQLDLQGNELTVNAFSEKMGELKEVIDVETDGGKADLRVIFNTRYLLDIVKILQAETEKITIHLTGPTSPAVIKNPADEHYTYVIVPLRTG